MICKLINLILLSLYIFSLSGSNESRQSSSNADQSVPPSRRRPSHPSILPPRHALHDGAYPAQSDDDADYLTHPWHVTASTAVADSRNTGRGRFEHSRVENFLKLIHNCIKHVDFEQCSYV